jgi:cytidine deaminase
VAINKIDINLSLEVFSFEDLPEQMKTLSAKAHDALSSSYSPYSQFKVAAAVLLANGEIVTGTNQENAAYPAGICAEGTAMSVCASLYPESIPIAIYIIVKSENDNNSSPVAPCGICRQRLLETEYRYKSNLQVWMEGADKMVYKSNSVNNLMPLAFSSDNL